MGFKILGISIGGGSGKGSGQTQEQKDKIAEDARLTQKEKDRRARMTPEELARDDIDKQMQAREAAAPGRPRNTLNADTAGKPMPGTDFSKFNYVQTDEYHALLNASNEKQKRLASEVTIAQSKPASRRSTKGGTVRNKQSAGGYESPFASLLGG